MEYKRIDSVLTLQGFPPEVKNIPPTWPTYPTPDKLSLLWKYNYHDIYHKFSPFTNYKGNLLSFLLSDKQPFLYKYIDETDKGILGLSSTAKALLSTVNINQNTINDVIRISKWQISSLGVQSLAKQALIQRQQPFDETRIYNPLSPILSTIRPFALGIGEQPMRHIEGGLLGLANSVTSIVGINLMGRGFAKPSSTAGGTNALPTQNSGEGKGLIRGADANSALAKFNSKWDISSNSSSGGIFSGLLSKIKNTAISLFGGVPKSKGIYRADENSADIMYNSKLIYFDRYENRSFYSWLQPWYGDNKGVRPTETTKIWPRPQHTFKNISNTIFEYATLKEKSQLKIKDRSVGYITNGYNNRYEDSIYPANDGEFTNSDILINFADFVDSNKRYESKFTEPTSTKVKKLSDDLKSVVNRINSEQSTYNVKTTTYSKLLSSGDLKSIGYDNLFNNIPKNPTPVNTFGVVREYNTGKGKLPAALDKRINPGKNLKFATTFTSDGLNQLGILKRNQSGKIEIPYDANIHASHNDWTEYKPYEDDLIAFFFYDVVNQKYIPFRATVKGISEGNTAFWDELRFIGRADQLYSYNGFSRTLSFSFNVVINSISELLPSWKRISYLASIVKPSNYTRSENINNVFNRFIVPPMFMITIGDLYKYQPIVIRNVTVNIPDDALWETLNQDNSDEWNYLNGIIKNPQIGKRYGQFPREAEINIEGALLEKERAQVGGSHYGHAPRVDNWEDTLNNGELTEKSFLVGTTGTNSDYYLPKPTDMHKIMIEANTAIKPNEKR